MKRSLYPRLAWNGMKNNKRLFVPYILAAAGTAAVFYIMFFLSTGGIPEGMRGGASAEMALGLGVFVIVIFSLIFLFYCNGFLVRRRYREFGLYSILGMNRRNISRVLAWETLFTAAFSLLGGVFLGVLLSKLAELGFVRAVGGEPTYTLSISVSALLYMLLYFGGIFVLIYISSLIKLHRSTAIDLVGSESRGEKPPKANPVLGIAGVIILIAAYYLAVSIENPISAFTTFFIAVVMVILGTYLVFISGSVLLCRLLQKDKSYYYKPQHFVSVSSMAYRMKRNGAGLASICILATMVLVMATSTSCLYFGMEDTLKSRYPRDVQFSFRYERLDAMSEEKLSPVRDKLLSAIGDAEKSDVLDYRQARLTGTLENGAINDYKTAQSMSIYDYGNSVNVAIVPLSDYNKAAGTNETLGEGEVLMHTLRLNETLDKLSVGGESFTVAKHLDSMPLSDGSAASDIMPTITLVVSDFDGVVSRLAGNGSSSDFVRLYWEYAFNTTADLEKQLEISSAVGEAVDDGRLSGDIDGSGDGWSMLSTDLLASARADFHAMIGGLFFLGIILSIVFICAAVLIIYYKQLSEGYEDAGRFEIMQKVGMTKQEIRRSINSQLLTVFFLPLVFAGLHLAFAFPFIRKILYLFSFYNTGFLVGTTVISFLVFAVLYALVYKKTSNTYYKIVAF